MSQNTLQIIVSGPYGGLNYGDDAIASVICSQLRQHGAEVILAVDNLEGARRTFRHIPLVQRLDLRRGRLASLRAMRKCDALLIGGGEQLSEPRVPNPFWGHLATNVQLMLLARLFAKRIALIGVGVDDRISYGGRFFLEKGLRQTDFIGVRDTHSQQRLSALLGDNAPVFLGADPAFLIEPFSKKEARSRMAKRYGIPPRSRIVLLVPSIDKFNSLDYLAQLNNVTKALVANGIWVLYAISDVQDTFDMELFRKEMLYTDSRAIWLTPGEDGLDGICRAIAAVDCVVSSRMHPVIFSLVHKTPFLCLSRGAKMNALMEMLGSTDYLHLNNFDENDLLQGIQRRLELGPESFFAAYEKPMAVLKQRASVQFDKVMTILQPSMFLS